LLAVSSHENRGEPSRHRRVDGVGSPKPGCCCQFDSLMRKPDIERNELENRKQSKLGREPLSENAIPANSRDSPSDLGEDKRRVDDLRGGLEKMADKGLALSMAGLCRIERVEENTSIERKYAGQWCRP
jgi:hypothetical protein